MPAGSRCVVPTPHPPTYLSSLSFALVSCQPRPSRCCSWRQLAASRRRAVLCCSGHGQQRAAQSRQQRLQLLQLLRSRHGCRRGVGLPCSRHFGRHAAGCLLCSAVLELRHLELRHLELRQQGGVLRRLLRLRLLQRRRLLLLLLLLLLLHQRWSGWVRMCLLLL